MTAILILAIVLPLLLGTAFLLGRHMRDRQPIGLGLSPVTRQHVELYQGGQLSRPAIEAAKRRFRFWLNRGEEQRIEAALRPGTQYVIRVRALAEIGTEDACRILERQLQSRSGQRRRQDLRRRVIAGGNLGDELLEQAWYCIDLAHHLRGLGRTESLPLVLGCFSEGDGEDFPLVHYFAAEAVCFPGFAGHVKEIETPTGRAALRALRFALAGLRFGVPLQIVAEARLGELLETAWDEQLVAPRRGARCPDPLLVRLFAEVRRQLRRADQARLLLDRDPLEQEAYDLQLSPLQALGPAIEEFLKEAGPALTRALAEGEAHRLDLLLALDDLRCDAAEAVLPLLKRGQLTDGRELEAAVGGLCWSRAPAVGPFLREWTLASLALDRRGLKRKRPAPPRRPSVPGLFPYRALLFTLRRHPSPETEQFLLTAAHDWDPTYRAVAIGSLGWWEPWSRTEVLLQMHEARLDPCPDVRHAARASLARLGERQALQWFRQALSSRNPERVHEAILAVAVENLTLLWPDLDRFADSEDSDVAFSAFEALEQMREELEWQT